MTRQHNYKNKNILSEELLLPHHSNSNSNYNSITDTDTDTQNISGYYKKKKCECSIYLYFKRKLKNFWKNIPCQLCCCNTEKEKHLCFFLNVIPEYNNFTGRPNENIIFWGNTTDEDVFFSEQEQIEINHMKENMKKKI